MRILVTGGAGYIGSVMTDVLLAGGHAVTVVDNLSRGHRDAIAPEASFVQADLVDTSAMLSVLRGHRIDAVIHMAGDALVGESITEPGRYYRNNLIAGLSLLSAMRDAGVKPVVFSSTCAVYGIPDRTPMDESMPTRPVNPYGESKLAFERALEWFQRAHGLKVASLRYFNAAGASHRSGERHEPETHLIPLVLDAAAGARPEIVVFGDDYPTRDGTCVRDYIHVLDLADAHVRALEVLERGESKMHVFNLGCGGKGYTNKEVIACAGRVTGRQIPVRIGPRRPGDPPALVASSEKAERELGWRPTRASLETIIQDAWRWRSSGGT